MIKMIPTLVCACILTAALGGFSRADEYNVDAAHAGIQFKISHIGLSWTYGRFNDFAGGFTIEPDAAKCAFALTIKAESIDTGNKKRDQHLSSPDFFNVKQFPTIAFQSTAVKAIKEGYEVTGNMTMHGVTKAITFPLVGGKSAEFPKGVQRTGFTTTFVLKRSEFGITKFTEAVGDDVHIDISFEGVKK